MLNYAYDPRTPPMAGVDVKLCRVPKTKIFAPRPPVALHYKLQAAKRCLAAAQSRQKAWADSHRLAKELKPGAYVFVKSKNLQPKEDMSSPFGSKLLPKFWGPFTKGLVSLKFNQKS